jgi:hypothetical protein
MCSVHIVQYRSVLCRNPRERERGQVVVSVNVGWEGMVRAGVLRVARVAVKNPLLGSEISRGERLLQVGFTLITEMTQGVGGFYSGCFLLWVKPMARNREGEHTGTGTAVMR